MIFNCDNSTLQSLDLDELAHQQFDLMTKPASLGFGRRLYRCSQQEVFFWVKTQLAQGVDGAIEHLHRFQHEIECYQYFNAKNVAFTLPFQHYEIENAIENEHFGSSLLVLPEANLYLNTPAQDLTDTEIVSKIAHIFNTLSGLHDLGWIHADLKQEHLVEYRHQLRFLDFEHAHKIELQQQRETSSKNLTATPRYMAPELFHGQVKTVQSDVYAVGIILLEWLCGQRLVAQSYRDWALLHCQSLQVQLPARFQVLQPLLKGLLAKHIEQRFVDINTAKHCLMTEIA